MSKRFVGLGLSAAVAVAGGAVFGAYRRDLSRSRERVREGSRIAGSEMGPIEQIDVPTLIITTKDDLFDTVPAAEYMAKRIPGAKLIVLDSGGHLFVGRQSEVNRSIADFLLEAEARDAKACPIEKRVRSA